MRELFYTRDKGFTLAEMLVSMFILALVIGGAVSLFLSAFSSKQQVLGGQALTDQISYLAEYMSRALRQAQKEVASPGVCLSIPGSNYEVTNAGAGIKFIDEAGDCREFKLESGVIRENNSTTGDTVALTSSDFEVARFQFEVQGEGQNDSVQPLVTFLIDIQGQKFASGAQPSLVLQTTLSQRRADIKEDIEE